MIEEQKKLLEELGLADDLDYKVSILEVVGMLVLCVHWLRGTFNWLMFTGAVKWPSEEDKANYERIFEDINIYEQFIWEIAPPRALLLAMRELRHTGSIKEGWEALLNQDENGRIPFNLDESKLDDIADVLRRLGEARVARSRTMQKIIEDAQK